MTIILEDAFINDEGQSVIVVRNAAGDIIGWNITSVHVTGNPDAETVS